MDEAMEEVFQSDAAGVRALIRGLSSYEFEEAVLSAYDAIRGAGMTIDGSQRFRRRMAMRSRTLKS